MTLTSPRHRQQQLTLISRESTTIGSAASTVSQVLAGSTGSVGTGSRHTYETKQNGSECRVVQSVTVSPCSEAYGLSHRPLQWPSGQPRGSPQPHYETVATGRRPLSVADEARLVKAAQHPTFLRPSSPALNVSTGGPEPRPRTYAGRQAIPKKTYNVHSLGQTGSFFNSEARHHLNALRLPTRLTTQPLSRTQLCARALRKAPPPTTPANPLQSPTVQRRPGKAISSQLRPADGRPSVITGEAIGGDERVSNRPSSRSSVLNRMDEQLKDLVEQLPDLFRVEPNRSAFLNWEVAGLLGSGTFASVYKVRHVTTGEVAAAKLLAPQKFRPVTQNRVIEMFAKEVRYSVICQCPGVVGVKRVIRGIEGWLVIQELIDGGTLWEDSECETELERFSLFVQLLQTVLFMQEKSVVHRDLKPTNILRSSDGFRLWVTDFGWSEHFGDLNQHTHELPGTIEINPPEVLAHQRSQSEKIDNYALGMNLMLLQTKRFVCRDKELSTNDAAKKILENIATIRKGRPLLGCTSQMWPVFLGLSEFDPLRRISLHQVIESQWFVSLLSQLLPVVPLYGLSHCQFLDQRLQTSPHFKSSPILWHWAVCDIANRLQQHRSPYFPKYGGYLYSDTTELPSGEETSSDLSTYDDEILQFEVPSNRSFGQETDHFFETPLSSDISLKNLASESSQDVVYPSRSSASRSAITNSFYPEEMEDKEEGEVKQQWVPLEPVEEMLEMPSLHSDWRQDELNVHITDELQTPEKRSETTKSCGGKMDSFLLEVNDKRKKATDLIIHSYDRRTSTVPASLDSSPVALTHRVTTDPVDSLRRPADFPASPAERFALEEKYEEESMRLRGKVRTKAVKWKDQPPRTEFTVRQIRERVQDGNRNLTWKHGTPVARPVPDEQSAHVMNGHGNVVEVLNRPMESVTDVQKHHQPSVCTLTVAPTSPVDVHDVLFDHVVSEHAMSDLRWNRPRQQPDNLQATTQPEGARARPILNSCFKAAHNNPSPIVASRDDSSTELFLTIPAFRAPAMTRSTQIQRPSARQLPLNFNCTERDGCGLQQRPYMTPTGHRTTHEASGPQIPRPFQETIKRRFTRHSYPVHYPKQGAHLKST